jgi:hypothetical protein
VRSELDSRLLEATTRVVGANNGVEECVTISDDVDEISSGDVESSGGSSLESCVLVESSEDSVVSGDL